MMFTIQQVWSKEDLEHVFRLRYEVYVEEMGRAHRHADHVRRRIGVPPDPGARILAAYYGKQIAGVVQCNFAAESDLKGYESLYNPHLIRRDTSPVSVSTDLVVARRHRGGTLAVRLAIAAYEMGLDNGIHYDFIASPPHLERFFLGLGYQAYSPPVRHPEYGSVLPLVLKLHDFEYLAQINSPFREVVCAVGVGN